MRFGASSWLLSSPRHRDTSMASRQSKTNSGAIKEGDKLPHFSLPADDGSIVTDTSLQGKETVLYFYPKDDTSGCTKEACEIRDAWKKFQDAGAVVLGVSTDDTASHVAFAQKYN